MMTLFRKVMSFFEIRRARRAGAEAGRRHAEHIDSQWAILKKTAAQSAKSPLLLKTIFQGWLHALHAHEREWFAALGFEEERFREDWRGIVVEFVTRYQTQLLLPLFGNAPEGQFTLDEIRESAEDIDGMAERFVRESKQVLEGALDAAVASVRAAEAAGRLAVDTRTDGEIRESIRAMWDADLADTDA
jgi:hypothetical protein